jgi:mRNA export factor
VSFHPVHGTFTTAGSDGYVNIWDKDKRQRLKAYSKVNGTVSSTAFNHDGTILAYAISYDWSKVNFHCYIKRLLNEVFFSGL